MIVDMKSEKNTLLITEIMNKDEVKQQLTASIVFRASISTSQPEPRFVEILRILYKM